MNDFLPNIDTGNPIFTSDPIIPSESTNELVLFDQLSTDVIDTLNVSPRIRLKLPNQFFEDKILSKAGEEELISNQNFVNYFRGIYIKAQQTVMSRLWDYLILCKKMRELLCFINLCEMHHHLILMHQIL